MRTIEIDCPGCQTKLELDGGFAGGVCRCSNCGTLMTVPADPVHERAERLTRPDRPDAPRSPRTSARSDAPSKTSVPQSRRPDAPGQAATADDEELVEATLDEDTDAKAGDSEVFTTASGKKIRVPRRLIVTAKAKRKAIRGGIIAVFIAFVVLMTAAVVVAIKVLLKPPAVGPTPMETQLATDGYDPSVNPFKVARPNFLGIPLSSDAVVAIDSSASSSAWLSTIKKAILVGTRPLPGDTKFQVIFWVEGGVSAYPDNPKAIGKDGRAGLASFLDTVAAGGEATPSAAVKKALSSNVDQVILVTGQALDASVLTGVVESLRARPNVRFDAVVIDGNDSADLRQLATDHQGIYMSVSTHQLSDWYQAADDAGLFTRPD